MPRETGRGDNQDQTSFQPDKSAIITNPDELPVERKDQYLKRLKKEDEALKEIYQVTDEYVEVIGKKVLRKIKKKNGNQYSLYWFNKKRHPAEYQNLVAKGGYEREDESGKKVLVPLKYVDGRPFDKKGKKGA